MVSQYLFISCALEISFLLMPARDAFLNHTGGWLLNESSSISSPQERAIFQKTQKLSAPAKEGFVAQIGVGVRW